MEMRAQYIVENEQLTLMRANKEFFDGIIEAFVHKGRNWYNHPIPKYLSNFPTAKKILENMVEDMRIVFPDLKIKLFPTAISVTVV
jgi:hypothetical protein